MRSILLSPLILPALLLVSAHQHQHNNQLHQRSIYQQNIERALHHVASEDRHLVARQRTSAGVLDGILGGDDDDVETSSTIRSSPTTAVSSRITPTPGSSSSTTITPSPSLIIASSLSPGTSSRISAISSVSGTSPSVSGTASVSGMSSIANSTSISGSVSASANASSTAALSSTTPSGAVASSSWSVDAAGQTIIVTEFKTLSAQASASAPSSVSSANSNESTGKDGPGISTSAIIGISIGVGVVVLSLIACAIWRMKRKGGDEDEAIRWPELNRHGDSDAHHALPARETGKHGFETNPLERSLSNSSSIFAASMAPSGYTGHTGPTPMALNGSNFGAASTFDGDDNSQDSHEKGIYGHDFDEKHPASRVPPLPSAPPGYDYSTVAATSPISPGAGAGAYPAALTGTSNGGRFALDHHDDDYTSFPPVVQPHYGDVGGAGAYESDTDEGHRAGSGGMGMPVPQVRGGYGGGAGAGAGTYRL